MQTKIIKINPSDLDLSRIDEAAKAVDKGGLVGFPTETVYGIACRVADDSLAKLDNIKVRSLDKYYTLHIGQKKDVEKYVPAIRLRAQKLINKCWPGPLTIVFELNDRDIKIQRKNIKKEVFERLYKDNSIGIRCPDHPVAAMLLQRAKYSVVAPSANTTGQAPSIDAQQVLTQFSGQIDILLDAGPCKYKKSSSVVKIGNNALEILRSGVYSETELKEMSQVKILLVCTGNTCRSPMAEGIFRKCIAEKLKCKVDQLGEKGYKVSSAGMMNMAGSPASLEAVAACAAKGVDIKAHCSQPLTRQLVEESDYIFAMTRMHCEEIIALNPKAAEKCALLAINKEIPDPIGQTQQVFNDCAGLIEEAVRERINGLWI